MARRPPTRWAAAAPPSARFDASEIDESVLAELPLEVQREVRAEIAAARAPPRAADAKRPAAAPVPAGGRRAAKRHGGGAQQPTLAAFVSGNGGANGSGGASNPMAEAFRSRGRTGPLAGGARSGGGGGGPTAVVPRESHDDALSRLLAMGFGRAAGEAALAAAGGDAQRAVEALLQ